MITATAHLRLFRRQCKVVQLFRIDYVHAIREQLLPGEKRLCELGCDRESKVKFVGVAGMNFMYAHILAPPAEHLPVHWEPCYWLAIGIRLWDMHVKRN